MGISIECTGTGSNCYASYFGFNSFRERVAHLVNKEFGTHYAKLSAQPFVSDSAEYARFFSEFDREAERLIKKHKISKRVVSFLWKPDVEGKIPPSTCKAVYAVIENCNDDGTTFCELKALLKDCCDTNSYLVWF